MPLNWTRQNFFEALAFLMIINCSSCKAPIPAEKRDCQACGIDNGVPNVRAAIDPIEVAALAARLEAAEISAKARNCESILNRFGVAVLNSQAVIARNLAVVEDIVIGDVTYTNYHRQLASGARHAEPNEWDRTRTQVDAALFPNFHQEIVFAALSLDGRGLSGYGGYVMALKEPMIARRASVFEANAYDLVEKLGWLLTKPIPPGFRAAWDQRDILAKVKLQPEITPATLDDDFTKILMSDHGGTGNSDFIEVHIYGPINKYTIDKVTGPTPRTKEDRRIASRLSRKLAELGSRLEMI